ncbi:MAG: hypothetical protein AAFY38_04145 [Pseudomonadota bacterium]
MKKMLMMAAGAALMAGAAAAEPRIYAYHTHQNFCPAGLQPVTMDGVICCGKPNQSMTYQHVMAHPVARKKVHKPRKVYSARAQCAPGTKGCSFD